MNPTARSLRGLRGVALGFCAGSLGVLAAAPGDAAQPPAPATTPPPLVIGAEVQVVSVPVLAFDRAGRFIADLRKEELTVLEDGVPQEITYLGRGSGEDRIPLSVALSLDTSGSMQDSISFLREAASFFTGKLEGGDTALVIQFNETVKSSAEFTDDIERLDSFIAGLRAWGATSLYDSIQYGLERLKDRPGRKALIVFSDGEDTSSVAGKDDVVAYARSIEASIYAIGIKGFRTPRGFLKQIAEETGGAYFFPDKVSELIQVFDTIAKELRNNYLVAYSPKRPADNTYRRIVVRVSRPDATVRVRPGYFALKARRRTE